MVSPLAAASARTGAEIACAVPANPTSSDVVVDLLNTYACSRMYPPIAMTVSTVVIAKTRVRMRAMNSRAAIARINVRLFIDRLPTHDVPEQLGQRGSIAPKLVHRAECQRFLQDRLLVGVVGELEQPARAVLFDKCHTGDAVIPAGNGAGDVHPEAQRSVCGEFVHGP